MSVQNVGAIKGYNYGTAANNIAAEKNNNVSSAPKLKAAPATDTVSFSGNPKAVEEDKNPKEEASKGKKFGVGTASFFIPGLGQAINGQWKKAAGFFFGSIGAGVLTAVFPPLALAPLGIGVWSVVDAVNNAKPSKKD